MMLALLVVTLASAPPPLHALHSGSFAPSWANDAVFYQIFPERFANGDSSNDPEDVQPWGGKPNNANFFGGDLQGIIQHLDYLSDLGISALYLNPIFEATSNHKYNTTDYLEIDPHFGDEGIFKRLVDECHARGIKVILDAVFNHTGVGFFAFRDIKRNGARSPYLRWYNVYSLPIGPEDKPNYECWWGHGSLPKLMTYTPAVRQYLFDVTRHWMDFGVDGWRLDVPNEVPRSFWIEWRKLVKSINPEAYIVGEIWDDATPWLQGDQFDAVMNYQFRGAVVKFFAQRRISVRGFDSMLTRQRAEYPAGVDYVLQNLLGSHDTERFLTLCGGDTARMKLAVLFQMTYVGAPMVYYGDEIGMEGGPDPDCRRTMVWDERYQGKNLLETYRDAIKLRKQYPVFRHGDFETVLVSDTTHVYAFARSTAEATALVVMNAGGIHQRLTVSPGPKYQYSRWQQIWPAGASDTVAVTAPLNVDVPPMGAVVFRGVKE
jgi:cyclomaltodextrinase